MFFDLINAGKSLFTSAPAPENDKAQARRHMRYDGAGGYIELGAARYALIDWSAEGARFETPAPDRNAAGIYYEPPGMPDLTARARLHGHLHFDLPDGPRRVPVEGIVLRRGTHATAMAFLPDAATARALQRLQDAAFAESFLASQQPAFSAFH